MHRRSLAGRYLIGLIGVAWTLAGTLQVQDPEPTVSVDVSLVLVNVEVFDSSGRPVSGLDRDDFLIFEDGEPREIRTFELTAVPYQLLVLFDTAALIRDEWLLERAAAAFMLLAAQFSDNPAIAAAFFQEPGVISDWQAWREQLRSVRVQGIATDPDVGFLENVAWYGALDWALNESESIAGRQGVVLFTSVETLWGSTLSNSFAPSNPEHDREFRNLLIKARQGKTPVFVVAAGTDLNPYPDPFYYFFNTIIVHRMQQARLRFEQLAEASTGVAFFPRAFDEIASVYNEVARQMAAAYALSYTPSAPGREGEYRRIEVRTRDENFTVRQSPAGYVE